MPRGVVARWNVTGDGDCFSQSVALLGAVAVKLSDWKVNDLSSARQELDLEDIVELMIEKTANHYESLHLLETPEEQKASDAVYKYNMSRCWRRMRDKVRAKPASVMTVVKAPLREQPAGVASASSEKRLYRIAACLLLVNLLVKSLVYTILYQSMRAQQQHQQQQQQQQARALPATIPMRREDSPAEVVRITGPGRDLGGIISPMATLEPTGPASARVFILYNSIPNASINNLD